MLRLSDIKIKRKYLYFTLFFMLVMASISFGTKSYSSEAPLIESIPIMVFSVEAHDRGEFTRIKITADKVFRYNILNHYEPLALVVEIPGAIFNGIPDETSVNSGAVTFINLKDALKKTGKQIEIMLSQGVNYQVSKVGTSLVVDIENPTNLLDKAQRKDITQKRITEVRPQAVTSKKQQGEYIIGGKDVIEITVYDEPDLYRKVRVSNHGNISFPLIGDVKVAGLTELETEKRIEDFLKQGYIVNPQVSINILEYRSNEIYILGAVNKPGAYPLMGDTALLEALSRAGGIATTTEGSPAGNELFLIREELGSAGGIEYTRIDLNRLLAQGDLSLNITLKDKDTIYVPQADSVFVFGEVNSPGSYKLLEKEITVLEAITMAGGLTKYAAPNRIRVISNEDGVGKIIKVDVKKITKSGDRSKDIVLKPGDVVVVPQSYF